MHNIHNNVHKFVVIQTEFKQIKVFLNLKSANTLLAHLLY